MENRSLVVWALSCPSTKNWGGGAGARAGPFIGRTPGMSPPCRNERPIMSRSSALWYRCYAEYNPTTQDTGYDHSLTSRKTASSWIFQKLVEMATTHGSAFTVSSRRTSRTKNSRQMREILVSTFPPGIGVGVCLRSSTSSYCLGRCLDPIGGILATV